MDESLTSETDIELGSVSEEDISNDSDTEEVTSDNDSEVIIVSEVKGPGSTADNLKKSGSKSSSAGFKKPSEQLAQSRSSALPSRREGLSSSSWWLNKVNVLEKAMTEMKAKFAEVLRQKVSIDNDVYTKIHRVHEVVPRRDLMVEFMYYCLLPKCIKIYQTAHYNLMTNAVDCDQSNYSSNYLPV